MPRPGPRPYECVRRAWHSDRHPPIRGSLIQEIFRIVNEVHSSATRKNREWQEKLPIVVLKAEEIIYSKANSEAEYSDLKTLWDRVNDAIDTIIRRDDTAESGDFLQPCIEAALHLGCTPRRSSRSQRNESPRCYLRPKTAEPSSVPPCNVNASICGNHTVNYAPQIHSLQHLTQYNKSPPLHPCSGSGNHTMQNRNHNEMRLPVLPKSVAPYGGELPSTQAAASSNTWSVYPLCFDSHTQPADSELYLTKPSNSYLHPLESDKIGVPQSLATCQLDAFDFISPSHHKHPPDEEEVVDCDLTLRLGSVVAPRASAENSLRTSVGGSLFNSWLR